MLVWEERAEIPLLGTESGIKMYVVHYIYSQNVYDYKRTQGSKKTECKNLNRTLLCEMGDTAAAEQRKVNKKKQWNIQAHATRGGSQPGTLFDSAHIRVLLALNTLYTCTTIFSRRDPTTTRSEILCSESDAERKSPSVGEEAHNGERRALIGTWLTLVESRKYNRKKRELFFEVSFLKHHDHFRHPRLKANNCE